MDQLGAPKKKIAGQQRKTLWHAALLQKVVELLLILEEREALEVDGLTILLLLV
jgi:hypothetical protein